MQPRCSNQKKRALTITEVLVVVFTLSVLAAVALAQAANTKADSQRNACVNNLKQICVAYIIWANEHSLKYPTQVPTKLGGAMEPAARGNVASVFQVMSNELSTPKVLVCPAENGRIQAGNFTSDFDNSHISYFVGLDATNFDVYTLLLSGDSNLAVRGIPVKSGLLNINTNQPINWTNARHINRGDIAFADGSVRTIGSPSWHRILVQSGLATNRLAIP